MLYYYDKTAEDKKKTGRRWETTLARKVLAAAVKKEYHLETLPDIEKEETGKPYFKGFPSICFNYSHCPVGILCGISKEPIGVDVEEKRSIRPSLPAYICHPDEKQILDENPHDQDLFWILWTAKEAYVKYIGTGIRSPLGRLDLSGLLDKWIREGCPSFHTFYWEEEGVYFCMDRKKEAYLCACGSHLEGQTFVDLVFSDYLGR